MLREDIQQSQQDASASQAENRADKVLSEVEAYQRQHVRLPARQREANQQDLLARRLLAVGTPPRWPVVELLGRRRHLSGGCRRIWQTALATQVPRLRNKLLWSR